MVSAINLPNFIFESDKNYSENDVVAQRGCIY